jgi:signal transduction histidine kinase
MSWEEPARASLMYGLLDWFVPASARGDPDTYRRARMFVAAHIVGPPLGLLITLYLYALDPAPSPHLWILVASIAAFFACPVALRLGAGLAPLSFLTVQNLSFALLFASYEYGGVSSPFLCWLPTVPLLASFYLDGRSRLRVAILVLLMLYIGAYYLAAVLGHGFPARVPLPRLAGVGALSISCVVMFVSMMAMHYASVTTSQQHELEREFEKQRATERQLVRAKEQAERASRTKTVFLANMSHELRTPLNAVIGFSEVMMVELLGPLGNPHYADYARDIHAAGTHLLAVINDILDLSKLETGNLDLSEDDVDIAKLVSDCRSLVDGQARKKGISVTANLPADLPRLAADELRLKQILLNLLSNAVKFSPEGATVAVIAEETETCGISLTVIDHGIGMRPEDIPVALQPFRQVDSTISRRYEGTGLGLPLAKVLAELHGGTLELTSAPGLGTTVAVTLPKARVRRSVLIVQGKTGA